MQALVPQGLPGQMARISYGGMPTLPAACPLCQKLVLPEIVVIEYPRTQSDQEYQSRGEGLVSLLSARGCGSTLGSHR